MTDNNSFNNIQGIINTGNMSEIKNLSVTICRSLEHLKNQNNEELADRIEQLAKLLTESTQTTNEQKLEGLDRLNTITVEVAKAEDKRALYKIKEAWKGIGELAKGITSAKEVCELIAPLLQAYIGG